MPFSEPPEATPPTPAMLGGIGFRKRGDRYLKVGGAGFEPAKAEPTDLQSVPFDRFGTPPGVVAWCPLTGDRQEPAEGFEPTTCCLQNSCSNQLSYAGTTFGSGKYIGLKWARNTK